MLHIIETKLIPPSVKEDSIRRAKLNTKLAKALHVPLLFITAGAGYGKSTTIALYFADQRDDISWYTVSSRDEDYVSFITYMVHALRKQQPTFGEAVLFYIANLDFTIPYHHTQELTTLFINECLKVKEPLLLVIDDFHHVLENADIQKFFEELLKLMPAHLHLIISSRMKPKWRICNRMRVEGTLVEIEQSELVLTIEEVELLLKDYYQVDIERPEIDKVYTLTEGWMLALGIIGLDLQKRDIFQRPLDLSFTLDDLFQYIALDLIEEQSEDIKQFLLSTSILTELNPLICNEILSMTGASAMLQTLFDRHLFLVSAGSDSFRYHGLIKELLERKLLQSHPETFFLLHNKAAAYFEKHNQMDLMYYHLLKSKRFHLVIEKIEQYALTQIKLGKSMMLSHVLQNIPKEYTEHSAVIHFLAGEINRIQSNIEAAEVHYEQAIQLCLKNNQMALLTAAYEGSARLYLDTTQPAKAQRYLHLAIEVMEADKQISRKTTIYKDLYYLLAENQINIGKPSKALKWLEGAKKQGVEWDHHNLVARLYLRTGKLKEALQLLLTQTKSEHFDKSNHLAHRETSLLLALVYAFIGDSEESKLCAEKAIEQGKRMQSSYVEACGWIRLGHSSQLLKYQQQDVIIHAYHNALKRMDEMSVSRGKAEPYMGLCLYWGQLSDGLEKALEYGELALLETEKVQDIWLTSLIKIAIARAFITHGEWEKAEHWLHEAKLLSSDCQDEYGQMLAVFWLTYIALEKQEHNQFLQYVSTWLDYIQQPGFSFFYQTKTLFGPIDREQMVPILLHAQKEGICLSSVQKVLEQLGFNDLTLHPGYTLKIETFSVLSVFAGEKEIVDWQRAKSKEMLALFITNPHTLYTKQELILKLWPDVDEPSASKHFKVVMNALNNTLETNRKARTDPFFIRREGHLYGLNKQAAIIIDYQEFERWLAIGLDMKQPDKAKNNLERALPLYKGDYLNEYSDMEWARAKRERLRLLFLRGAERLSQIYISRNLIHDGIEWCERILTIEPTWEEAYRLLMYCYYRLNNRPQSMRIYQKCKQILQDELAVEPLPTTDKMYEMIIDSYEIG